MYHKMKIETLTYTIDWSKFRTGQSFFVPCIDHEAAKDEVKKVARRLRLKLFYKIVIEEGIKGLRVWRL